MSFAAETKKELTLVREDAPCQRAELEAILVLLSGIMLVDGRPVLVMETENVATARRIYTHLKEQFGLHPEVFVRKKMRLKKNNVYAIRIARGPTQSLFTQLNWPIPGALQSEDSQTFNVERTVEESDTKNELAIEQILPKRLSKDERRAYLRGAFLASGSVNSPGSHSYHLELSVSHHLMAKRIQELMNEYGLHAKTIVRKKGYVVYLKEGEKIVEFLSIIGAHQALLKFEDTRILKGMRNQVNRLVNCETANMNKTIAAAVRQVEAIQLIDNVVGLASLSNHLREVAEIRLKYPEVNLQELCGHLQNRVSKSGLNHRFRKLEELAVQLGLPKRD